MSSNFQGIDFVVDVWEFGGVSVVGDFLLDFLNDLVMNILDDVRDELRVGRIRLIKEIVEWEVKAKESSPHDMEVINSRVFGVGYGNNVKLVEVDFVCAGASGGNHDR